MQTKIVYTCVIKSNKKVLCEYTKYTGKFTQMVKKILDVISKERITDDNFKIALQLSKYHFYILYDTNLYIMAMTNQSFFYEEKDENIFFCFLFYLNSLLKTIYSKEQLNKAAAYSLTEFLNEIKSNMSLLNDSQKINTNIGEITLQIENIKTIESLYHKQFFSKLNFEILDLEQVHQNESNEWDPAEIRLSSCEEIKVKQLIAKAKEEGIRTTSINDAEGEIEDYSKSSEISSDSYYGKIESILRSANSNEIPMISEEVPFEKKKNNNNCKCITIIVLSILIVIISTLSILKFVLKIF